MCDYEAEESGFGASAACLHGRADLDAGVVDGWGVVHYVKLRSVGSVHLHGRMSCRRDVRQGAIRTTGAFGDSTAFKYRYTGLHLLQKKRDRGTSLFGVYTINAGPAMIVISQNYAPVLDKPSTNC